MMINSSNIDILSRLDAMRVQDEPARCFDYFRGIDASHGGDIIDEACRGAMVTWIRQIQRALSLDPETVWIAVSFLDRYLSSRRGDSRGALRSKRKFQLAAITAYYIAVKIYEPVKLSIGMLLRICRGAYAESDITSMESDILNALNWRVSCHTPLDFARDLLRLLPELLPSKISNGIMADCQKHLEDATANIHSACSRPSDVGIGCLASSLTENIMLSLSEKRAIWARLSESCHFILSSDEAVAAQRDLISDVSFCKLRDALKQTSPLQSYVMGGESSPICVTKTARQA